ncbi:MAG: SMP-30/gluconolactonase/LRE family protein [Dehalococcoidia bacterium]|jgi:gluconolactonase|nr:SMP-30/gluconolactonase/LRE family protein [Dehalococcoidia bacterium]MDP7262549.1 SMP-30/gluconolactonase/LRE family protein [Dehalococcoidia bacterium]MDP7485000.1 SMP-30/gluconolactonase/LRE family protein [Dehalococcoidia bacterium]|tara:strand:+ start:583 stop:1425 length:843 start_codon:yes stop_codon:yes gene_type:complete
MTTDLTNIPPDFRVLVSGVRGPEGPAIDSEGRLHLVSSEDAAIIRVSKDGDLAEIASTDGRPNGLVFNSSGEMLVADAARKAILRIDRNNKTEVFVDEYEGTALGGPNDLCFLPNGDLLFTDPIRRPQPDPAISPVYRVTPEGKVSAFANELAYPNGIAVSSNGTQVYVSESRAQRLVAFTIGPSAQVLDQQLIRRFKEPGNPDGMAVDIDGNILQTLPGIRAIAYVNSSGELLDLYHVPNWAPANLAFGGDDMKTVFVCGADQDSIYEFRHRVAGAPLC